jgi:hypothetical protein
MNKELKKYLDRYFAQIESLKLKNIDDEQLKTIISEQSSDLNNVLMAGMGACTLIIRFGAVYQLVRKLAEGSVKEDALLTKQIIENLRETLPSDTNWKLIWEICCPEEDEKWSEPLLKPSGEQQNLLEKFISFRNKYVHGYVTLDEIYIKEIYKALSTIQDICCNTAKLFIDFDLFVKDDQYYLNYQNRQFCLHPFVQKGDKETPYIFQGLYQNKSVPELIGVEYGDLIKQESNAAYEEVFEPLYSLMKNGSGNIFNHSEKMKYYLDCFVGRNRELELMMNWVNNPGEKNVLNVFSEAGMGKGALTAGFIDALLKDAVPVMYHFCGSGIHNNLQAVLYHFILQGKNMPGMNGAGVWQTEDELLKRKMQRLPSRYFDAIKLFQSLLSEFYSPTKKYKDKPLVIVIDGLDEAAVANNQLKISDWFYTYNDKDEIGAEWRSPAYIKWVFTYRSLPDQGKKGYRLPEIFKTALIPELQPLKGLTEEAVKNALSGFNISEEFLSTVIEKGAVI